MSSVQQETKATTNLAHLFKALLLSAKTLNTKTYKSRVDLLSGLVSLGLYFRSKTKSSDGMKGTLQLTRMVVKSIAQFRRPTSY